MKKIALFFLLCTISTTVAQKKEIFYINLYSVTHKSQNNPNGPHEKYFGTQYIDTNLSILIDSIIREERPDKKNWIAFIFQNIYTIISYEKTMYKDSCEILVSPYITKIIPGLYKENYIIKSGEIRFSRKKGVIYYNNVEILLDIYKKI